MSIGELLFGFRGRLRRRDYWLGSIALGLIQFFLIDGILALIYGPAASLLGGAGLRSRAADPPYLLVSAIVWGIFLWPELALTMKRRHDRDKSGAFAGVLSVAVGFVSFVPEKLFSGYGQDVDLWLQLLRAGGMAVVGLWLLIVLGFMDGTPAPNTYGPGPKGLPDATPEVFS
jgi:uncharacterized membrane protein YhaH (DUF805 family)